MNVCCSLFRRRHVCRRFAHTVCLYVKKDFFSSNILSSERQDEPEEITFITNTNEISSTSVQDGDLRARESSYKFLPASQKFPQCCFCETGPLFIWLAMVLSRPFKEAPRPWNVVRLSKRRWSIVCRSWLRSRKWGFKLPNISDLSPSGSPSRGGDIAVYVFNIKQPSLPTPFDPFLCLFLSLWPFQLYSIP